MREVAARFLLGGSGRVRLSWRLAGFVGLVALVTLAAGLVMPAGVQGGAGALLAGSLVAGWRLLALEGRAPGALGFYLSPDALWETVRGLALGVAVALTVIGVMVAFGGLRWSRQDGSLVGWFAGGVGALGYFALPAAAEEAFLRGYPLQALSEVWGGARAVAATAIVFGLLHLGNPGAGLLETVNVAVAGLLLGVVYLRTLSLWWATGVHVGWNWAHGYLADLPVSGLEVVDAPFYEGFSIGPEWLGGGAFGPEGSAVTTVVVLFATAVCWWGPWLRPGVGARAAGSLACDEQHEPKD